MSTVPPKAMQTTVNGFLDETPYDPFLGEPTEEQLAHIHSHNHTPNPPGESFALPQTMAMSDDSIASCGIASTTAGHAAGDNEIFEFNHNFSRIGTGWSLGSLGLGVDFDADNTPFPILEDPSSNASGGISMSDPIPNPIEVASPTEDGPPSRKSSGLASLSTHLMSPTLTASTLSPSSPRVHEQNKVSYKLLGGGEMTRASSSSTSRPTAHLHLQQTPAMTSSSAMTSPGPTSEPRLTSPIVRVENTSQNNSPARVVLTPPTTSKRIRDELSQFHLSHPPQTDLLGGNELVDYDTTSRGRDQRDADTSYGRAGLSPAARMNMPEVITSSINEQAKQREISEKNSEVAGWILDTVADDKHFLDPNHALAGARKYLDGKPRTRSVSTSKNFQHLQLDALSSSHDRRAAQDRQTPGPNVLVDEDSEEDEEEEEAGSLVESTPASIDGKTHQIEEDAHLSGRLNSDVQAREAFPWLDPIYLPSVDGRQVQPGTSNAAIARWIHRNQDIETASRAATWGTRRLSDSTLDQVLGETGLLSRLRLTSSKDKEHDEARSSLQEKIDHVRASYRAFRSNSINKRKSQEPIRPVQRTETYTRGVSPHSGRPVPQHERKESSGSISNMLSRIPSGRRPERSRPTTPRIDTGAMAAITTAGLGLPGTSPTGGATSPSGGVRETFKRIREGLLHRYASDDSEHGSIAAMMRKEGTMPPVASLSPSVLNDDEDLADVTIQLQKEDEDVVTTMGEPHEEKGVKMAMPPRKDLIIPTFDGFKGNVRDVNPRLEEWLVERLGQEQLRRYKRLLEYKVNHTKMVQLGNCPSAKYCIAKGGSPRYFQLPKNHKDSVGSADVEVQFDEMDADQQAIAEGAVSEAQFPVGMPMPPVERLPAEFECPLCFQVKKFNKPSDWSKHVHEDMQPFTCTHKECSDPKSFKRKADWVRHENERHRQLEWWECVEEGCAHRCYRRDNFVQHLIREHKLPETSTKPTKQPNKPAVRGPAKSKGRPRGSTIDINDVPLQDKVLHMVNVCRHATEKKVVEENCRFCGNVCNSWKKLNVHLARHMVQLSLPVLDIIKAREVTVDTVISPLEPRPPVQATPSPVDQMYSGQTFNSPRPAVLVAPATSTYVTGLSNARMQPTAFTSLSAATSPVSVQAQPFDPALYQWTPSQEALQFDGGGIQASAFSNMHYQAPQQLPLEQANYMAQAGMTQAGNVMFTQNLNGLQQQLMYSAQTMQSQQQRQRQFSNAAQQKQYGEQFQQPNRMQFAQRTPGNVGCQNGVSQQQNNPPQHYNTQW